MDAAVMYGSKFWVSPEGEKQVFGWLDGGHCAEVVAQPGFLFAKRLKLEQKGDDGWDCYLMLYGLASRKALDDYFANTALHEKFARERASFMQHLRMERFWGKVESTLTPGG